ncbi:biotin/lipoyl-containing protein [Azospirillum isscasi]|uniref:Biotin/lipoyl-containing protein n=1 Tax=Azospirillum isscasi TaxID=3053926 RepID=A0ABU0WGK7_9PROT|nr:biotin/lipoyl-containing protein [Azospirillum isscasi]MDQ2103340.1 biotin/lipoyl-containing protein [Azospirillum isscasi]
MSEVITVPLVNANEDQVQVVEIRVSEGQAVRDGDPLFALETTKSAVEVLAPADGVITGLKVKVGDFVTTGAPLCRLERGEGASASAPVEDAPATEEPAAVHRTLKARLLARELGIPIAAVPAVAGRVGEAEVRAYAGRHRPVATVPARADDPMDLPFSPTDAAGHRLAVIVGGGRHAPCVIDGLEGSGYRIVGCVDSLKPIGETVLPGIRVLGRESLLEELWRRGVRTAFIGVGGTDDMTGRAGVYERLKALGFTLPPVIHRSAVVGLDTIVGDAAQILMGATVGPRSRIGANALVNQGSIVCHDSEISDHAHITPGAILAGAVRIGPRSIIGMGATVRYHLSVGADCLVHNGVAVVSNVADGQIVTATRRMARTAAKHG